LSATEGKLSNVSAHTKAPFRCSMESQSSRAGVRHAVEVKCARLLHLCVLLSVYFCVALGQNKM